MELTPERLAAAIQEHLLHIGLEQEIPHLAQMPLEDRPAAINHYLERFTKEIGVEAVEGLRCMISHKESESISVPLRQFENLWDQGNMIAAFEVIDSEVYSTMLQLASGTYQEGDITRARAMFTFLQVLNPFNPEAIIGQIMIEWQLNGVNRAAELFDASLELFEYPMMNVFAADCYIATSQSEKARQCLKNAEEQLEGHQSDEAVDQLRSEIQCMLQELG